MYQARRDYPESFLSNHTEFVYYYNESGYYQVTFSFRYLDLTGEQKQAMFNEVDSIVAQARAQTGGDTVGMLRYFQQALCERAEYDFAAARSDSDHYPNSYHAYGALMEGKSVCQGYAYAFKLLCDKAQIPCWIVTGTYGDEPHAWNYVWVNNNYYLVDVTWDDANNRPADSASFLAGRDHAANYHVEDNCAPGTLAARSYSETGTTVIRPRPAANKPRGILQQNPCRSCERIKRLADARRYDNRREGLSLTQQKRIRDAGVIVGELPCGQRNKITDVPRRHGGTLHHRQRKPPHRRHGGDALPAKHLRQQAAGRRLCLERLWQNGGPCPDSGAGHAGDPHRPDQYPQCGPDAGRAGRVHGAPLPGGRG